MQNGRRVIVVDVDDVQLDFNSTICLWHNLTFGTNYCRADVKSWQLAEVWKCSIEEMAVRVEAFYDSEYHDKIQVVEGALHGLSRLAGDYSPVAVTNRPERMAEKTLRLLDSHGLRDHLESAYFVGTPWFPGGSSHVTTKADVCRELNALLAIEDSMGNAKAIAEVGVPVLLLDTPWNQGETPRGVTRVPNWPAILEKIYF